MLAPALGARFPCQCEERSDGASGVGDCRVASLLACVDGPVDARAKLRNLTGGSIAVMCPACWRGCMAAGPDGFRDPAPNNDAAWLAGRCEYRVLRIVGSTDRHLTQLCHPGINARSGAVG